MFVNDPAAIRAHADLKKGEAGRMIFTEVCSARSRPDDQVGQCPEPPGERDRSRSTRGDNILSLHVRAVVKVLVGCTL